MDNNAKEKAAVTFAIETQEFNAEEPDKQLYTLKEHARFLESQVRPQVLKTSDLLSHVHLGVEGSVACELKPIDPRVFKMHPKDEALGLKVEDDSIKLHISTLLFTNFFYEKCEPSFAMAARKYVENRIAKLGVIGYALELSEAEECLTNSIAPKNGTERLACTLYSIDPVFAMAYVTLAKRQCYSNIKGIGSTVDAFLGRNDSARAVEEFLSSDDASAATAFIRNCVGEVIHIILAGYDVSHLNDHSFFGGIPKGTPLEGTSSFKTKVEAEITGHTSPMNLAAYYDVYYGPENREADSVTAVKYLEVPKNLTKKRGISEFGRLQNEAGTNIVRACERVAKANTYGALDLVGQDASVNRVFEGDMEEFATLDSSNCTDSYTREHLKAFPSEIEEPLQRLVPTFVNVNGRSVRNYIALYMGFTGTTFLSSVQMFAYAYVVGSLVEAGCERYLPVIPADYSPEQAVRWFDRRLDERWCSVEFFDKDEDGNNILVRARCERITVWNDDVIVPAAWAEPMMRLMRGLGFIPNAAKSYVRSSLVDGYDRPDVHVHGHGYRVRESCGAFKMRDLETGETFATKKLPTITRDDMPLKAIGVVRAASVAELFESCGYPRSARLIRSVVQSIVGNGFFDNFAEHGYFDDAPETVTLEEVRIGSFTGAKVVPAIKEGLEAVIFPKAYLSMVPTPDYIIGKKAQTEDRSAAYNIYLQERYYASMKMVDGEVVPETDHFGIDIRRYNVKSGTYELVDFAEAYGIRADHMTYAEFIKTEEDVSIVRKESSKYDEYAFNRLRNWVGRTIYFEITQVRAGRAVQKLVNNAQRRAGNYGFFYPVPAVMFLLHNDPNGFRNWTADEVKVALHLLNPDHIGLVEVTNLDPQGSGNGESSYAGGDAWTKELVITLKGINQRIERLEGKTNSNSKGRKTQGSSSNQNKGKGSSNSGSSDTKN